MATVRYSGRRTKCCWVNLVKSFRVEDREVLEITINMHSSSMMVRRKELAQNCIIHWC
jgi:hypothetical protein